jgi:hypothetical protein
MNRMSSCLYSLSNILPFLPFTLLQLLAVRVYQGPFSILLTIQPVPDVDLL